MSCGLSGFFLLDSPSDWPAVGLARPGKGGGQDCVCVGVSLFLKGVRSNGTIPPIF